MGRHQPPGFPLGPFLAPGVGVGGGPYAEQVCGVPRMLEAFLACILVGHVICGHVSEVKFLPERRLFVNLLDNPTCCDHHTYAAELHVLQSLSSTAAWIPGF